MSGMCSNYLNGDNDYKSLVKIVTILQHCNLHTDKNKKPQS